MDIPNKLGTCIIAGGRDYYFTEGDKTALNELGITEVVSGGARGADSEGEAWANSQGIPIKRFPAEWDRYGKSAGFRRNVRMAEYAESVVLFPGGRGTDHMYATAKAEGLTLHDLRHLPPHKKNQEWGDLLI